MFVKTLSVILLSLSTFNAAALNESTVVDEIQNYVINGKACPHHKDKNFWSTLVVPTQIHTSYWHKEDYNVYVSKFGCELGKNGSVVIAPGRTESSLEFYETAIDLTEKGFSPIYVVDHVGQGFSPRLLPDEKKGHIVRFDDYVDAFDSAVTTIELDLNKNEGRTNKALQPLFFLSNSMGGAIGIGYFQNKGNKNPFKAAALLGPMIRINYLGFPQGDEGKPNGITHPTLKETLLYSEHGVITQAHYFCTIKGCDAYSTKAAQEKAEIHGTAYIEGKRDFDAAFEKAPEQVMTHSKERYNLKTFLWEDLRTKQLYSEMGFNNPQMAEPTYQWVKQAAKFNKNMRKKKNIELMSTMPIRIITGEKDVRSYTPSSDGSTDLSAHIEFCDTVNSVKSAKTCQFTEIKGAYHELLKESELYREPALEMVVDHFLAN